MVVDAGEDVGEPSAGIDVVEFAGLDQCVDRSGTTPAAVGAGEDPVLAADSNAADGTFGGVVREADTAIVKETPERWPSLQVIVDRLGEAVLRSEERRVGKECRL